MADTKHDLPNLDLIAMVQRARMEHDAQATPSQVGSMYWIEAKRQNDDPAPTSRQGHFGLHVQADAVDAIWNRIKAATESGDLGYKAKVSTAARGADANERLIYVVTYDADDTADVARIRARLQVLVPDVEAVYERT